LQFKDGISGGRQKVSEIEPGMRVRHPDRPDWGLGQVQSVIGNRVTVNFEHAGKLLLNLAVVSLELVED
jgi:FKBP-type peptidyl-prolyl cis-trans isomerase 2